MHSSYALASSEFSVERDGASSPLADLWPGYRPDDRLGVVLANPMDAVGCSNLICGTNTLFYDDLRATRRRRQLLPVRRHLPVRRRLRARRLQPARRLAAAQVRDGAAADCRGADRDAQRPPDHAARDPRHGRPLPRRGRAVDVEHVPRDRPLRRHVLAAHRQGARRRRDAGRQPRGRVVRRAGHLHDARHRRRRAGAPAPAAPQPRPRADAVGRVVPLAPQRRGRTGAARRHAGAAARPPGADAPVAADHDRAGRAAAAAVRLGRRPF